MISEDKIFYNPGDLVKVKHDLDNTPTMYVVEKVTKQYRVQKDNIESKFIGIKCRWFDVNNVLHEAIFSTKDLLHI